MTPAPRSPVPGQASEEAVEATEHRARMISTHQADPEAEHLAPGEWAAAVLEAAHDPALGFNRSVCLREVVEVLDYAHATAPVEGQLRSAGGLVADHFMEPFSQGASPSPEGSTDGNQ